MPKFSILSLERLRTCHPNLERLFMEVIKHYDCMIIYGYRDQASQEQAFKERKSKLNWPDSQHNKTPSMAVDVAPCPLDWNNVKAFYHFGGFVRAMACQMEIEIRWGGDWDGDYNLNNQQFNDLPHFELK